jgi:hypothetical protein
LPKLPGAQTTDCVQRGESWIEADADDHEKLDPLGANTLAIRGCHDF